MDNGLLQPETLETSPPNRADCELVIIVSFTVINVIIMGIMEFVMLIMRLEWIEAS